MTQIHPNLSFQAVFLGVFWYCFPIYALPSKVNSFLEDQNFVSVSSFLVYDNCSADQNLNIGRHSSFNVSVLTLRPHARGVCIFTLSCVDSPSLSLVSFPVFDVCNTSLCKHISAFLKGFVIRH
jgi:hypothetical protein